MADAGTRLVTLAIPCRTDEPALGRTLDAALASWRSTPEAASASLEVLVCINGTAPETAAALAAFEAFARGHGELVARVDADDPTAAVAARPPAPLMVVVLLTREAGKPHAWNLLRRHARGARVVFLDADVAIAPATLGLLLGALAADPAAVIASAKTVCVPRPTSFERVMAAPYGVDFPNLSAQLYAARTAALPPSMPTDLIEPERWLELVVGQEHIVRVPEARVQVRLPADLADFLRQRVRIEMGKVQIAHDYAGLLPRSAPQPRGRAALRALPPAELLRLGAYLALRLVPHLIAQWRVRTGRTAGVWKQAASTKRWEDR